MSEEPQTISEVPEKPGPHYFNFPLPPKDSADVASTSQPTLPPSSPFQSKLSAHNVSKNASTMSPKHGKQPQRHFVDPSIIISQTFTNSTTMDNVTTKCEQLELSEPNAASQKGKNARKKQQRKENQVSNFDLPNLNFNNQNPIIHDYFSNHVGPMYSGSQAHFNNMAHHPQFQYLQRLQAPHTAPVLQTSSTTPPGPPSFTPPAIPTFNAPVFPGHAVQNQQFLQNMNNAKISQRPNMNGVHGAQYLKNLMQHPLFRNSVAMSQEGQVLMKTQNNGPVASEGIVKTPDNKQKTRHRTRKRKPTSHYFEDYLTAEEVEEGLTNGTLQMGVLRINPKQYLHSYITTDNRDEPDIFIDSMKRRNRAMEGDIVVVKLIDKEENVIVEDDTDSKGGGVQEEKKDDDDGNQTLEASDDGGQVSTANEDVINERRELETKEDVRNNKRGKVVYIKRKVHTRTCIGQLKLMPDKNNQRAFFVPRDYRVPRLNIPCTSWPDNFHRNFEAYENTLFLAKIVDWQDDRFAMGTILQKVGQVGNLQTETLAILAENDLDVTPFGPEVKEFFPGPDFIIPEEEISKREDCRQMCIFSIDPYNCRDVDDAVSCRFLENGNYEIGVHISDVSYFLKEKTSLDEKVADKATTVYLVERAYHMLPEELCMLCSLFSGVDKLAFSIFWEITPEAEVLNYRFTRTVIHSCAQLAYEHAQAILDDGDVGDFPQIHNGFKFDDIERVVKTLGKISSTFRRNRFEGGALKIDQPKVNFRLNPESGLPESFHVHESKPSHQLIEEFMLLANMTVAERIHRDHPKLAFLRCHPAPSKFQLEDLAKQLSQLDIKLDITSAGSLYQSMLPHIGPDCENKQKALVLSMLCTKPMTRAKYFCADGWDDEDFGHYALNVPLYTHFTSPIRRYADIMVHRLLAASLQYTEMPTWEVDRVRWVAANCNKQKYNAKKAGEMSTELYTHKYIEMHSPVTTEAVVVDVKEKFFDVIVIALGLNRRIYIEKIPGAKIKYERSKVGNKLSKLTINWLAKKELPDTSLTIELFAAIQVQMVKVEDLDRIETKLVRPL